MQYIEEIAINISNGIFENKIDTNLRAAVRAHNEVDRSLKEFLKGSEFLEQNYKTIQKELHPEMVFEQKGEDEKLESDEIRLDETLLACNSIFSLVDKIKVILANDKQEVIADELSKLLCENTSLLKEYKVWFYRNITQYYEKDEKGNPISLEDIKEEVSEDLFSQAGFKTTMKTIGELYKPITNIIEYGTGIYSIKRSIEKMVDLNKYGILLGLNDLVTKVAETEKNFEDSLKSSSEYLTAKKDAKFNSEVAKFYDTKIEQKINIISDIDDFFGNQPDKAYKEMLQTTQKSLDEVNLFIDGAYLSGRIVDIYEILDEAIQEEANEHGEEVDLEVLSAHAILCHRIKQDFAKDFPDILESLNEINFFEKGGLLEDQIEDSLELQASSDLKKLLDRSALVEEEKKQPETESNRVSFVYKSKDSEKIIQEIEDSDIKEGYLSPGSKLDSVEKESLRKAILNSLIEKQFIISQNFNK